MADIKLKDLNQLETWNDKELRKLRIVLKNRISALKSNSKKELPENHPLFRKNELECEKILEEVIKTEARAKRS